VSIDVIDTSLLPNTKSPEELEEERLEALQVTFYYLFFPFYFIFYFVIFNKIKTGSECVFGRRVKE
jgi:hypothetical protein